MKDGVPPKFQRYVVTDLPRLVPVKGHHHPAPFWITPDMFEEINIAVAGQEVSRIVSVPHADPHVHENENELWVAPSEKRGDVVIEATLNEDVFQVESPFVIMIPAGTRHCFAVVKCDAPHYVFGIKLPL